jgi:hypothetical protein
MKETYTCPRCLTKYGDRSEEDSIMFVKNAGYIALGCCGKCETPEEDVITDKTWKTYLNTLFGEKK